MSVEISKTNVLGVNATVIIGLIILFTFQSISSSFIETESSNFILGWNEIKHELSTQDRFLEECKILREDRDAYEEIFLEAHQFTFSDDSSSETVFFIPSSIFFLNSENFIYEKSLLKRQFLFIIYLFIV